MPCLVVRGGGLWSPLQGGAGGASWPTAVVGHHGLLGPCVVGLAAMPVALCGSGPGPGGAPHLRPGFVHLLILPLSSSLPPLLPPPPSLPPPSLPSSLPLVILSPSGLNAVMTGHSYNLSDTGIDKILEEWKLFYPRRFNQESSLGLPAAIEVVIGGVRMRYPSQFVLVYHSEDSLPTPPPSPLAGEEVKSAVQEVWETSSCVDTEQ